MARLALLMPTVTAFETYCRRKEELAKAAVLSGFYTIENVTAGKHLIPIGSDWTCRLFDGDVTTSPIEAGEPNTPFYKGSPPARCRVLEKAGRGAEAGVRFEHFLIQPSPGVARRHEAQGARHRNRG